MRIRRGRLCGCMRAQLPRKYSHVERRQKDEVDDSEQVYSTNEGDVLLSISGTGVFVGEGFDLALARKLRDSIASVQSEGPLRMAGVKAARGGAAGAVAWAGAGAFFVWGDEVGGCATIYFRRPF